MMRMNDTIAFMPELAHHLGELAAVKAEEQALAVVSTPSMEVVDHSLLDRLHSLQDLSRMQLTESPERVIRRSMVTSIRALEALATRSDEILDSPLLVRRRVSTGVKGMARMTIGTCACGPYGFAGQEDVARARIGEQLASYQAVGDFAPRSVARIIKSFPRVDELVLA